jgi:hypothetical protein
MAKQKTLDDLIRELQLRRTESDLTISIMQQVAQRLHLRDPELFDDLYETVIFYTRSWPAEQGWGSSDTSAVLHSFIRDSRHVTKCVSCDEAVPVATYLKNFGLCDGCAFEPTKDQREENNADQDRAINANESLTYRQRTKLGHTSGG